MMIRHTRRRPGSVVVVAAISLIAVLGALALSLDGGMMLDKRRQVQAAADAAAMSAGAELYARWFSTHGLDTTNKDAEKVARAAATAAGYTNGVNGCSQRPPAIATSVPSRIARTVTRGQVPQ